MIRRRRQKLSLEDRQVDAEMKRRGWTDRSQRLTVQALVQAQQSAQIPNPVDVANELAALDFRARGNPVVGLRGVKVK